jgi:galactokinase
MRAERPPSWLAGAVPQVDPRQDGWDPRAPWAVGPHMARMTGDAKVSITGIENAVSAGVEGFLRACDKCWPVDQARPRVVVRAPGRLDCMGGMADFSGTLALQMPIARSVHVAAGRRDDQKVHINSLGWSNNCELSCYEWPLNWFYQSDGEFVTPAVLASRLQECPWARHVAGVCLALLESGEIPHFGGGMTLVYQSDIPPGTGLASSAALQVATAKALACLFGAELDARRLVRACRTADVEVVGAEPGLVDHLPCLLGEPGSLLQIRCQPDDVLGPLPLPQDVVFVALDTGVRVPIRRQRYADNRTASMIGRFLIEQMLETSGEVGDPIGGYLANISPSEYVSRFRNNLPVKLRGGDFLSHFGHLDAVEAVDPDQIYKVRSRTEHHI